MQGYLRRCRRAISRFAARIRLSCRQRLSMRGKIRFSRRVEALGWQAISVDKVGCCGIHGVALLFIVFA
jgi:hypothetical protein